MLIVKVAAAVAASATAAAAAAARKTTQRPHQWRRQRQQPTEIQSTTQRERNCKPEGRYSSSPKQNKLEREINQGESAHQSVALEDNGLVVVLSQEDAVPPLPAPRRPLVLHGPQVVVLLQPAEREVDPGDAHVLHHLFEFPFVDRKG